MMNKRYPLLLTGGFLLAGVVLGLLLYFPLPEAVAVPEPTVSPTPRADMVLNHPNSGQSGNGYSK